MRAYLITMLAIVFVSSVSPITVQCLAADSWQTISVSRSISAPEPFTGIVVWDDSDHVAHPAIAMEYAYVTYSDVSTGPDQWDWTSIEKRLDAIAGRGHQAILRFHDTYPGKKSGAPQWLQNQSDYKETKAKSEGKQTYFPDWSSKRYQEAVLATMREFVNRYDSDARLAFLQVGFGLWAEYHIYDGPMKLGKTFPEKSFQENFLTMMNDECKVLRWMISIDAANDEATPIADNKKMIGLNYGLFDDSFMSEEHAKVNALNWRVFGIDRYQKYPCGGEFSYYTDEDQKLALTTNGPHGISFESSIADFHLSFIIGSDQPELQSESRLVDASRAMGYEFKLLSFEANGNVLRGSIKNTGVAPIYYDAFPSIGNHKSAISLMYLQPDDSLNFEIRDCSDEDRENASSRLTIQCDRLPTGVSIPFHAELP